MTKAPADRLGFGPRPATQLRELPAILVAMTLFSFAPPPASTQPRSFAPDEETPEQLPAGAGREKTFYACTACHNFRLVAAQGMSRRQWEDSLAWMTERHGMPPLHGEDRERVLSYLESTFPPRPPQARRGWQNPFAPR